MIKTICDRCGEICAPPYGQDSSVLILRKQSTGSISLSNIDLCEKCKKELTMLHRDFLEIKGGENK